MKLLTTIILMVGISSMALSVQPLTTQTSPLYNGPRYASSPTGGYTGGTNPLTNTANFISPTIPQYLTPLETISDPGGSYGGGTSTTQSNQVNQINSQLGQLDNQQNVGLSNIGNSYNRSLNQIEDQRGIANRNYNQGTQQNTQSYANTRDGILQNTRQQSSALQRLLGINGAGNSSAAYEQAPYAAALQGSQNLNQAQNTYGNNETSLDNNWQDTLRNYGRSKDDLNTDKYGKENALRQSIAQTRLSLTDRLAQANGGTLDQGTLNDLLSQITSLGQQYQNPVLQTGQVNYAAPAQNQYSLGQQAKTTQGGAASDVNQSFLGLLGGGQRDKYGQLIG